MTDYENHHIAHLLRAGATAAELRKAVVMLAQVVEALARRVDGHDRSRPESDRYWAKA